MTLWCHSMHNFLVIDNYLLKWIVVCIAQGQSSRVPQGTVLGPHNLLIYIKGLPAHIPSHCRISNNNIYKQISNDSEGCLQAYKPCRQVYFCKHYQFSFKEKFFPFQTI